jgi:hypothetical protein
MSGLTALARRIAEFDRESGLAPMEGSEELDPDVARFLRIIQAVTPPGVITEEHLRCAPLAGAADELIDSSEFLRRLGRRFPAIVVGPVLKSSQWWIATGRPIHLPSRVMTLAKEQFVDATKAGKDPLSTKPFHLGLYTSSGFAETFGLWWWYLRLNRPSTLFPLPWQVWSVGVREDAKVREIGTASEWAEFVSAYPVVRGRLLYPDWACVARDWDGVHMTLRAIAATQGVWFASGRRVIAAPYWDVESVLWLRWVFTETRLVTEVTTSAGDWSLG